MGLFGAKKGESKKADAAPQPDVPAPSADAGAGDIFGGVALKQRRKRGMTTLAEDTASQEAAEPQPAVPPADAQPEPERQQQQPFFAKFDLGSGTADEKEAPEVAALRRRLEVFYEEYNPSKLSQIDQTIQTYMGKEAELFDLLVKKYGPEPKDKSAGKDVKVDAALQPSSTFEADTPDAPSGFTFAANNGFGTSDGEAGWSAVPADDAGGFAFDDAAGGGFQFAAGTAGGFEFAAGEAAPGFTFAETEEATGTTGFTFGEVPAPQRSDLDSPTHNGVSKATPDASSDDDDDAPTLNERHRTEMNAAQQRVLEAKQALTGVVASLSQTISSRRESVVAYRAIELDIEACIASEAFEKADTLNTSLEQLGATIEALDVKEKSLQRHILDAMGGLKGACKALAVLYRQQRQELLECKADEERRVNKYITETSSKLDTQLEKLAASLDRANRTLHNTEQEVVNIEQRHQKIQEKINDQTKGLRDSLSAVTQEKDELDAEIRQLEQRLQQKRRQSAEKKMQLTELEEKLKIIMEDFSDTVEEVSKQLHDEQAKRQAAQSIVDELSAQEERLMKDQREFTEEKEAMQRVIQQNTAKIDRYESLALEMQSTVPEEVEDFLQRSLLSILEARAAGRTFLAEAPHKKDSSDAASPLATLANLQSTLRLLEQRLQDVHANEASMKLRLQDIRKNIPLLEAAKKAAAQAKQFKEAQQKTEELKRLSEESAQCDAESAAAAAEASKIVKDIEELKVSIADEQRKAHSLTAAFLKTYRTALEAAHKVAVEHPTVNVLRLGSDGDVVDEANLCEAVSLLYAALDSEVSQLSGTQPQSSGDAPQEIAVEDFAVEAPMDDIEAASSDVTPEEIREQIQALEAELNAAMDDEQFDICESLQQRIDALESRLRRDDQ